MGKDLAIKASPQIGIVLVVSWPCLLLLFCSYEASPLNNPQIANEYTLALISTVLELYIIRRFSKPLFDTSGQNFPAEP